MILSTLRAGLRFTALGSMAATALIGLGAEPSVGVQSVVSSLEFVGYMRQGDVSRFALADPKQLTASPWLVLGQTFGGYTLEAFDAERDVLSVRKSGELFRLPL